MKIHSLIIAFGIIIGCLAGCASTTGIDPSSLSKSTAKSYVELKVPFKWQERFNIDGSTQHLALAAGVYKPKYDDGSFGTYYEGKDKCLTTHVVYDDKSRKEVRNAMQCGIFVPNTDEGRVIVYFYIDAEANRKAMAQTRPGILIEALAEAEIDNLKHLMYQPEEAAIKAAIKVVK